MYTDYLRLVNQVLIYEEKVQYFLQIRVFF